MNSEPLQQSLALGPSPMDDAQRLLALLDQWAELGWLRALDVSLTRFLMQQADGEGTPANPALLMAIALTSHQLGRGHVCLDLGAMEAGNPDALLSLPPENAEAPEAAILPGDLLRYMTASQWHEALDNPLLVADNMTAADPNGDDAPADHAPLVRDGLRLYLRRYWRYEHSIARQIQQRLQTTELADPGALPTTRLKESLQVLFGPVDPDETDWQRLAVANSARQNFSIITGGPGTGKTTTVVRLLAALQYVAMTTAAENESASGEGLIIRLAAPTGKAAARLNESLAGAVEGLALDNFADGESLRQAIPTRVSTLHRLMGTVPGSRKFRHHRHNPLLLDVLVIDEASMVDVEMMACLLEAMPVDARLILLGDKDQLASVDAGAVLGDLCARATGGHYSKATRDWLGAITGCQIDPALMNADGDPLDQAITLLRKSYRFDRDSGIGQLAATVNQTADATTAAPGDLFQAGYADIARLTLSASRESDQISRHCVHGGSDAFAHAGEGRVIQGKKLSAPVGYQHFLTVMKSGQPGLDTTLESIDEWAWQVLAAHGQFQVLCALRRGRYGVEGLNALISDALYREGLIAASLGWYAGRPVLVTANDYSLGLMNGDIGVALEVPLSPDQRGTDSTGENRSLLRVAFPANDGSGRIKWVMPSRLTAVETVYAMTIHKAQGSEFTHACLILPDRRNPILTRELVYTGITRARHWFSLLLTNETVFAEACRQSVTRTSGLLKALSGTGAGQR